jgi:hypothetical protein
VGIDQIHGVETSVTAKKLPVLFGPQMPAAEYFHPQNLQPWAKTGDGHFTAAARRHCETDVRRASEQKEAGILECHVGTSNPTLQFQLMLMDQL